MPDAGLPDRYNPGAIAGDAFSGAGAGAAVGSSILPGFGTAIGGGIGLIGGGLAGLIGESFGPSSTDIYNSLMSQFTSSPEYQQMQDALGKLQDQTVNGPTAQERQDLNLSLQAMNRQFNSQYGQISDTLARTQGVGSGTQAGILAAQGSNAANQMSSAALQAAAQESARQEQAKQAYAQATMQANQMQDQYRQWASGQAYGRAAQSSATTEQNIAGALSTAGSITAAALKPTPAPTIQPQTPGGVSSAASMAPGGIPANPDLSNILINTPDYMSDYRQQQPAQQQPMATPGGYRAQYTPPMSGGSYGTPAPATF